LIGALSHISRLTSCITKKKPPGVSGAASF
jgi:hypothetical protein